MRAAFLDASLWLEAMSPKLERHALASARFTEAVREQYTIVTTPLVIAEVHAMVVRRRGSGAGTRLLDDAFGGAFRVIFPDNVIIRAALDHWVRRLADHRISLCDAVSFAVMRRERISRALTFDRHFAAAGFEIGA